MVFNNSFGDVLLRLVAPAAVRTSGRRCELFVSSVDGGISFEVGGFRAIGQLNYDALLINSWMDFW